MSTNSGTDYVTKVPLLSEDANIQIALKDFLYGSEANASADAGTLTAVDGSHGLTGHLNSMKNTVTALTSATLAKSLLTAKGSIISASAASTPATLLVGTNGYGLVADSSAAAGIKWHNFDTTHLPLGGGTLSGALTVTTISGTDTTESTNSTTGAFKTAGGLGVLKNLHVGGALGVGTAALSDRQAYIYSDFSSTSAEYGLVVLGRTSSTTKATPLYGMYADAITVTPGATSASYLIGINGYATHNGTTTVDYADALRGQVRAGASGGSSSTIVSVAAGLRIYGTSTANSAKVTTNYGIVVGATDMTGASTTNNYGLYISNISGATNNYALVANDGFSVFNDTNDASSSTTGAVRIAGGVGIAKKLYVGTTLDVTGATTLAAATLSGTLSVSKSTPGIVLDDTSSANLGYIDFKDDGVLRWRIQKSAANHFAITRYNSSGVAQENSFHVDESTGDITLPSTVSIGSVDSTEISYLNGVTSAIQTQLNAKFASAGGTITGNLTVGKSNAAVVLDDTSGTGLSYIDFYDDGVLRWRISKAATNDFGIHRYNSSAVYQDSSFLVDQSTGAVTLPANTTIGSVDNTEIGYLNGVTSAIQTQLNAKAPLASPQFTSVIGVGVAANANYAALLEGPGSSTTTYGIFVRNSATTTRFYVRDDGYISFSADWYTNHTSASAANVVGGSGGAILRSTSSIKYKTDIRSAPIKEQDTLIKNLRPVIYKSKCEADDPDKTYWGFIAEDVELIDPRLVDHDENGEPSGLFYDRIIPALVGYIQRLEKRLAKVENNA